MMDRIFISIASYCDPLLIKTILDALQKARYPDRLRFGVVEQHLPEHRMTLADDAAKSLVRYIGVMPQESRGVCWARSVANGLYEGEEYFLQIDAHMLFDEHWDVKLTDALEACPPKSLLSSYPNHFEMIDGVPTPQPVTHKVLAHVVKPDQTLTDDNPILLFQAIPLEVDHAVRGFHLAGGCLFGPGRFLTEVPYDPRLYFHGEEQTLAARAYTHGWDIWHPCGLPLYHYYDLKPEESKREKHWSEASNTQRYRKHWEFEQLALERVISLLYQRQDLGVYGLGRHRSLDEYGEFSGLDYSRRTIQERARLGIWGQTQISRDSRSKETNMSTITIDGQEYDLDSLSAEVKSQLQMVQLTDAEITRLTAQLAIAQTARRAYAVALQLALLRN